jgi:hypothetical protein
MRPTYINNNMDQSIREEAEKSTIFKFDKAAIQIMFLSMN